MKLSRLMLATGMLAGSLSRVRAADELPKDAEKLVMQFEQDVAEIQSKADAEVIARRDRLFHNLKAMRDSYAKDGKYDEALAIHDQIRDLQAERVEVEQGGMWWPAQILKRRGDKAYVRYAGWDEYWNEWVTKDRIRKPSPQRGPGPVTD
jgi:hypothetical protein